MTFESSSSRIAERLAAPWTRRPTLGALGAGVLVAVQAVACSVTTKSDHGARGGSGHGGDNAVQSSGVGGAPSGEGGRPGGETGGRYYGGAGAHAGQNGRAGAAGASDGGAAGEGGGAAGEAGLGEAGGAAGAGGDACANDGNESSWDASANFSATANPCGVWSYGYTGGLAAAPFVPYVGQQRFDDAGTILGWEDPNNVTSYDPDVGKNGSSSTFISVPPGGCWAHPGPHGEYSIFRFTAPSTGRYHVKVQFFAGDSGETDGAVVSGTDVLFEQATSDEPKFATTLELLAGSTLDVGVGITGAETFYYGTTPLVFQVSRE